MKTKITLLLFTCILLASCSKWPYGHDDDNVDDDTIYNDIKIDEAIGGQKEKVTVSPNEIIVSYEPEVTVSRRQEIRDSVITTYPSLKFEECDCGDTNIELWIFDPSTEELEIQGVVNGLPSRRPRGKTRAERSLIIDLPEMPPFVLQGPSNAEPFSDGIPGDSDVNIAVIDTGIDFWREDISTTKDNYLFPSGAFSDCYSTQSGWNFISNDPGMPEGNQNILDENGHGTYVTKIITDILDRDPNPINYQILPLKVFDSNGEGSYWDVLCAFAYVKSINQGGGDKIDIINASFGGGIPEEFFEVDSEGNQRIFAQMLDDLKNQNVLVVTSAGNKGVNNEVGPDRDFISYFKTTNLLTVGGYFDDSIRPVVGPVQLHPKSNYGPTSIDVALAYNDYGFIFETSSGTLDDDVSLDGTSYSAAAMSGLAARLVAENGPMTPEVLKETIFTLSDTGIILEPSGRIIENRVLLRE